MEHPMNQTKIHRLMQTLSFTSLFRFPLAALSLACAGADAKKPNALVILAFGDVRR